MCQRNERRKTCIIEQRTKVLDRKELRSHEGIKGKPTCRSFSLASSLACTCFHRRRVGPVVPSTRCDSILQHAMVPFVRVDFGVSSPSSHVHLPVVSCLPPPFPQGTLGTRHLRFPHGPTIFGYLHGLSFSRSDRRGILRVRKGSVEGTKGRRLGTVVHTTSCRVAMAAWTCACSPPT